MENVVCNLCGVDNAVFWGEKSGIRIVRCRLCGLIYCNPRLDNEELQRFYSQEYFSEGHYEEDVLRQKMYEIEISEVMKNIATQGRFLDVGCAMGKFLHTLPASFEKHGLEFSEAAAEFGRNKFGLNIVTGQIRHAVFPEAYFDIIQMRGVLEHSQNPIEDLVQIRKLLKDDGVLRISQLPNIGSLCGRWFKTGFNQVKPKEHLYYFTEDTIRKLLKKTGFLVKRISFPYLNTPYASLCRDILHMATYKMQKKDSPPFFGNMMILYAQKA